MKDKEITALRNIISKLNSGCYGGYDLGTAYEQADYVILKSEDSERVANIVPITSSVASQTLKQANLRFGFIVFKELMMTLSNPKLRITDDSVYKKTLHRLTNNSSKKSGELFVFNPDTPAKLRLAQPKDVINALTKVINALKQSSKIES